MSDSIQFSIPTSSHAKLLLTLPEPEATLYVQFDVYFASDVIPAFNTTIAEANSADGGGEQCMYPSQSGEGVFDQWYDCWTADPLSPGSFGVDRWMRVRMIMDDDLGFSVDDFVGETRPREPSTTPISDLVFGFHTNFGSWEMWMANIKAGTTPGGDDVFGFDARVETDFTAFTTVDESADGEISLVDAPVPPPPFVDPVPPPPGGRFFSGFEWRFLFTAIDVTDPFDPDVMETTSWADGLLTERRIAFSLGQATAIDAAVWPDDIRVNEIWTDGYPRVAPLKRMVWAFRRENPAGGPPWVCRACGILMTPQDEGDADVPLTHFTAYDPRKLLEGRPVMDADGGLPGPAGFTNLFLGAGTGDALVLTLLANTIANEGSVFVDAGVAYGGTAFYAGTIEMTDAIDLNIQQGQSVADIWNQVEQMGNCDIILTAIYDPVNRPGYTHEVSVYSLAGTERPRAVFAWDRMNRSVTKISRLHDQTPGAFFDKVNYAAGQGGIPPAGMPLANAAAVAAFGSVWQMQFFPSMADASTGDAVLALGAQALQLAKQGRRTMTLQPTPERAPIPILDYELGDRVPIYATKRLRVTADGYQRVESIPIEVDDDGIERVGGLLCSPDWRGSRDS